MTATAAAASNKKERAKKKIQCSAIIQFNRAIASCCCHDPRFMYYSVYIAANFPPPKQINDITFMTMLEADTHVE